MFEMAVEGLAVLVERQVQEVLVKMLASLVGWRK